MKKLSILILTGLLLPAFVFGAVEYSRTPSGYTITSPVVFSVEYAEPCVRSYWSVVVWTEEWSYWYSAPKVNCSVTSHDFSINLPVGEYFVVEAYMWWYEGEFDPELDNGYRTGDIGALEGDEGEYVIFEVVGEEPTGFLTITPTNITGILAYIQGLFHGSGLWPLVVLAIGIPLGLWASAKFIDLVRLEERPRMKPQKWFPERKLTRGEKKENWL